MFTRMRRELTVPNEEDISLDAGTFRVNRDLDELAPGKLEDALDRLVTSDAAAPVIEFGEIRYLPSRHVADIHSAADGRPDSGRSLTIRAKSNVATMLERMGLGAVARVKRSE